MAKPLKRRVSLTLSGIIFLVVGASIFVLSQETRGVVKTWDGGGTDGTCGGSPGDGNKWTCAANWSPDGLPAGSDTVIFDGAISNKNATASSTVIIAGLTINANYTGTITQVINALIGAGGFVQNGGTYIQSGAMTIGSYNSSCTSVGSVIGSFTLNNGIYTQNAASTIYGNIGFTMNNGTYNQNNTLTLSRPCLTGGTTAKRNYSGGFIYNNGTYVHNGSLTIGNGSSTIVGNNGYVQVASNFTGGLNKNIICDGSFTVNTGNTFNAPTGTGTLTINGDLNLPAGSTFNFGTTGLTFQNYAPNAVTSTLNVPDGMIFPSLTVYKYQYISSTGVTGNAPRAVIIPAGQTIEVTGTLTLDRGYVNTGTIEVTGTGTLVNTAGTSHEFSGGTGIIHMSGTAAHNITVSDETFPGMTIDNSNFIITAGSFMGDVTLNTGVLNGPVDGATDFGRDFILGAGGTFTAGKYIYLGKDWDNNGGTFTAGTSTIFMTLRDRSFFTDDSTWNDHVITGTNTFYNFRDEEQYYLGSIKFESGLTQTITNWVKISGLGYAQRGSTNHGSRMPISSTTPGVAANVNLPANTTMAHISLADINNTGTSFDCNVRCADNGGNTNIDFTGSIHVYVSEISRETSENGGTATFTVYLTGRPLNNVTIPVASSDAGEGTPSTAALTFTSANWETKQTVTVTGQDDVDNDGTVAYSIQLGSTSSLDSRFNGLDPDDVSVKNQDNDSASTAIDFDQLSDFDVEDVQNTAASSIGAFYNWGYAQVSFYHDIDDYNNSIYIDLTTSKIKPGCKIDIGGTVYTFLTVVDESVYDYSAELSRDGISLDDLDTELYALNGEVTVNSITCVENQNGGVKLNDDFIKDDTRITSVWGGDYAISDTAGDHVFFTDSDADSVRIVGVADSSVTEVAVGNHPGAIAYDSTRDNIWVLNEYDDTVTVIAVATGSVEDTYATDHQPKAIAYDSEHDDIWIGTDDGVAPTVNRYDPSDGSEEASLASDESFYRMAYDSADDVLWLAVYSWGSNSTDYYAHYLVRVNVLTDAYVGGSFASSMVQISIPGQYVEDIEYDAANGLLWIVDNLNYGTPVAGSRAFLTQVRTSDGVTVGADEIGYLSSWVEINPPRNEVWTMGGEDYTFNVYDLNQGGWHRETRAGSGSWGSFTVDGDGGVWFYDYWQDTVEHVIPEGVAKETYYTVSSTVTSQLDTTGQSGVSAAAVTETLNGQDIFYAVSFDARNSFKVWGSWRTIASNKAADHGGVDGNWYWRDNDDPGIWTAATPNDKNAAISAAVAAGANNQMTGTEMAALAEADWQAAGGFVDGVTTTLDISATFYTDDPFDSPVAERVEFTLLGGGAPPALSFTNDVEAGPVTTDTVVANWDIATIMLWDYDDDGICSSDPLDYDYDDGDSMDQNDETNNGMYICLYGDDGLGNTSQLASSNDINIDATPPAVTISDDEPGTGNIAGGDITFTFDFDESVTGFDATDITTGNGAEGLFTPVSGTQYTLVVTPTAGFEGNVTIDVNADGAFDAAGNGNDAPAQYLQAVDMLAPTVTIDAPAVINLANVAAYTLTGTCSENGENVDVDIGGVSATPVCGGGTWSTGAIDVSAAPDNLALPITADHSDAASNPAVQASTTILKDILAPTVLISDDEPGTGNIAGGDITFTFDFDDTVTGFDATDITTGNGAEGLFTPVSGTQYTLVVTPTAGFEGNVTIDVAAGAFDAALNPNTVPATYNQPVDMLAPTVLISDDEPGTGNIAGGDITFTFDFDDTVTGFDATDITTGNGAEGLFTPVSGTQYTLVVTPTAGFEGNITIDVTGDGAVDAAGNGNDAPAQYLQAVDMLVPTVVGVVFADDCFDKLISEADIPGDCTVTVQFSEDMNTTVDPTVDTSVDISSTLGAPTAEDWTVPDADRYYYWTFALSDADAEAIDVDFDFDGAADPAGNPLTLHVDNSDMDIDTLAPTLSFTNNVEAGPVVTDTITATWGDASVEKWEYDGDGVCSDDGGTYGKTSADSMFQDTEANNGDWICLYGEDAAGNKSTLASANPINIDATGPALTFTNDVEAGPVIADTITGDWDAAAVMKWEYDDDNVCSINSGEYGKTSGDSMDQFDETNNGDWICLYGEDVLGNKSTLVSANPINVDITPPTLVFTDNVSAGPVISESVAATYGDATISGWNYDTDGICSLVSGDYTAGLIPDQTDESHNGDWICLYGEDALGNKTTLLSANDFNIDATPPTLSFTDDVDAGPVVSDTIAADWGDSLTLLWDYDIDGVCSLNLGEYDYDNFDSMDQIDETHNGDWICLLGEDALGNKATLLSVNQINIDITPPSPSFIDNVEAGPIGGDIITPDWDGADVMAWGYDDNGICSDDLVDYPYDDSDSMDQSDETNNGTWICLYVEDALDNDAQLASANDINIDDTAPALVFTDNVAAGPVVDDEVTADWDDAVVRLWGYDDNGVCSADPVDYPYGEGISMSQYDETHNGDWICLYGEDAFLNAVQIASTNNIFIDRVATAIIDADTADTDLDGTIDQITLEFSELVAIVDGEVWDGLTSLELTDGCVIANGNYANPSTTTLVLSGLTGCTANDTSLTPSVTYDEVADCAAVGSICDDSMPVQMADDESEVADDSASPVLLSVSPADGATDVPQSTDIAWNFSEPMATDWVTATEWTLSEDGIEWTPTWSNADRTVTVARDRYIACKTLYEVTTEEVQVEAAAGEAGFLLFDPAGPEDGDWTFETSRCRGSGGSPAAFSYSIDLTNPDGGNHWQGGATYRLEWTSGGTGIINQVNLAYSTDGGASYSEIAHNIANRGYFDWTVPDVTTDEAIVRIQGSDLVNVLASDKSAAVFSIIGTEPAPEEEAETPEEEGEEETGAVAEELTGCDGIAQTESDESFGVTRSENGLLMEPMSGTYGLSPVTGSIEPLYLVRPGDLVRSYSFSTVYCITTGYDRRPFMDETSYFTEFNTFDRVKWVSDATLSVYPVEKPMMPDPTATLGKFESSPTVYRMERSPDDPYRLTLRAIDSEMVAIESYGENWADYVIDLNPTLSSNFEYGAPVMVTEYQDTSGFRKRELLNETSKYTLSINTGLLSTAASAIMYVIQGVLRLF